MSAAAGASGVMCSAADVCVVCVCGVCVVWVCVVCVVCVGVVCVYGVCYVCAERKKPQITCHEHSPLL